MGEDKGREVGGLRRWRSPWVAWLHDVFMLAAAWLAAYWLRFDLGVIPTPFLHAAWQDIWLVVPIQSAACWSRGLYRGLWRFASVPDLLRIMQAVFLGTTLALLVLFLANRSAGVPRAVPLLDMVACVLLLGGPRLAYRLLKDTHWPWRPAIPVLVVGTGLAAEATIRELKRHKQPLYRVAGLIDDHGEHRGRDIYGVRVIGSMTELPEVIAKTAVRHVLIALGAEHAQRIPQLRRLCEQNQVQPIVIPGLAIPRADPQRALPDLDALLGRAPAAMGTPELDRLLPQKVVLVTGAGGSIGSQLCHEIAAHRPQRLILLDHAEGQLYEIARSLQQCYPDLEVTLCLGSVVHASTINRLMAAHHPHWVFHAAAYKHVPMLEDQLIEAIRNNLLGTRILAEAACRWGSERFVLVSSDKAVEPANVLGATKQLAERLVLAMGAAGSTAFFAVRFGNVLGSSGSVVPLFQEQIAAGGPVTITHPEARRFFMTIEEACMLILHAALIGRQGDILVLDMGQPMRIIDLANHLILLSGKRPGQDIPITITGLRPGEKLAESLFTPTEHVAPTTHPKIRAARPAALDDLAALLAALDKLAATCDSGDTRVVASLLQQLTHTILTASPPAWPGCPKTSDMTPIAAAQGN